MPYDYPPLLSYEDVANVKIIGVVYYISIRRNELWDL
nr:MAG TPA: hypothetical protein [Caudoviricetes sp.]